MRFGIGINLGGKDFAGRDATQFTNDLADRALRAALPIFVGPIGKVQRPGKERAHRVERTFFVYGIAVKMGRTAQRTGSQRDVGNRKTGAPQLVVDDVRQGCRPYSA